MMEESELVALLSGKIHRALNDEDGDLSASRQKSLDYYLGEPYGNERTGYSQYTSREVLETVEWCLPALVRIFAGSDQVVSFTAVGPEDEAQAAQETDAVNAALGLNGDYFMTVYQWIKSALLDPVAYTKAWMETHRTSVGEAYYGLTDAELALLTQDAGVEITEHAEQPALGPNGEQILLHSVRVKRTEEEPRLRVMAIPGEETLIDANHTHLSLDEAEFVCHRTKKTYSWLVSNGYDRDLLDEVSPNAGEEWGGEKSNRLWTSDESWSDDEDADKSLRTYWLHEISALVDFDDDGVAERRRIVMIGDTIFENEEYDYQPITPLCAIPMPFRHPGLSEADLVKDLQLLKSTLIRQMMDNIYRVNRPKQRVGVNALTDDGKTVQALLDPLSEFVPCEDPSAIVDEQRTSYVGEILPVIQFFTDAQQTRTGIAPNLSLDPSVIQQSTAGAFSGALEQASQRVEMLARIFAETGFKWLALKVHRLLKEHSQRPFAFKRKGQWVEVNPADWRDRSNVEVHVGLGFNDKTKEVMLSQTILAAQQQLSQFGIVSPENMMNAFADLITASGKKQPERYITPPPPPQPPQPDPNMILAQAQAQAMQMDAQAKMIKAQTEQQNAQLEAQIRSLEARLKAAESQASVQHTMSDASLKDAQRMKVLAEAREQQMDNEAIESGVIRALEGGHGIAAA